MLGKPYEFAIVGKDLRQLYLATILAADQHKICHYGLCNTLDQADALAYDSLEDAVKSAQIIIGPIPLGNDQEIANHLVSGQSFFAGCIPQTITQALLEKGVYVVDLMQEETLAVYNTIATTEGALCEAITKSPLNLHRSQCAVLGYGRCGKTLVQYLKGMFCHINVYTASPKEQAEAGIIVEHVFPLIALNQQPDQYDFIFNTIPAQVIDSAFLEKIKEQAVIIDIASAPGGVDYQAAAEYEVCACQCLG